MALQKHFITGITAALLLAAVSGCGQKNELFSGKDLTGWAAFPADTTHIWSVQKGVIRCQGSPKGYLRTEKEYSNYHLHLEWRWVDNPTNSGVLLHTTGPDRLWPNAIEAQLQAGNAGDIYLIGDGVSVSKFDITLAAEQDSIKRIPKQMNSSENIPGEWNSYDIFCKDATIRLFVNGFMQNEVTQVSKVSGSICLQSEGSPIEFKNLYIEPMKANTENP